MGIGWRYANEGICGVEQYLANGLALIIVMYPLFALGTVGAGDIKLLAVAEGFFSFDIGVRYLVFTLFIGACIGLVKMCIKKNVMERLWYLVSYLKEIALTGRWQLYFDEKQQESKKDCQICMTIPMLISFLLYKGGIY